MAEPTVTGEADTPEVASAFRAFAAGAPVNPEPPKTPEDEPQAAPEAAVADVAPEAPAEETKPEEPTAPAADNEPPAPVPEP